MISHAHETDNASIQYVSQAGLRLHVELKKNRDNIEFMVGDDLDDEWGRAFTLSSEGSRELAEAILKLLTPNNR